MDQEKHRIRARKCNVELTAQAIEIAMVWDSLPEVAQEYVIEIINGVRRVQHEDAPIARRVWTRADPKRVKALERKIERYQAADRQKRRS